VEVWAHCQQQELSFELIISNSEITLSGSATEFSQVQLQLLVVGLAQPWTSSLVSQMQLLVYAPSIQLGELRCK
jgi:hypothetical protein